MLRWLAELLLKHRIQRANALRNPRFLQWDHIEKIALILDGREPINKNEMDRFIGATQKFVEVFYVEPQAATPSFSDWRCFSKKDRSVLQLPKNPVTDELQQKKFDLVINTAQNDLYSNAVAAALPAPFKCGNSGAELTDLLILRKSQLPVLQHLNDVVTYLKMIRTA